MLNKTIYQGRLTKDPELKQTQSGISTMLFTVAWSEKYKETETKCFLLCKAWRYTAEFIAKYFRKGSEILLDGRMVTETWADDKQVTLLLVDKAHFCGKEGGNAAHWNDGDFADVPEAMQKEIPFKERVPEPVQEELPFY